MQIRGWTVWLDHDHPDDERAGTAAVDAVRSAIRTGGAAPPVAVVLRGPRLDLFPLGHAREAGTSPALFIAGLSRSTLINADPVDAVGVAGVFAWRPDRASAPAPVALVFLEWSDCRWWSWRALLSGATPPEVRDDTETLQRAVDGDGKPSGLGGWWSLGRRRRMSMHLDPMAPPDAIVH